MVSNRSHASGSSSTSDGLGFLALGGALAVMARSINLTKLDSDFYLPFGRALANWARVEQGMGHWFVRLSGMKEAPGLAVFYSARSFQGRVDMVRALVEFARTVPAGREFIRDALNVASAYSQFRNRLAHDRHAIQTIHWPHKVESARWISSPQGRPDIGKEALEIAADNFGFLANVMIASLGRGKLLVEPELSRALLSLLPPDQAASRRIDHTAASAQLNELLRHQPRD